MSEETRGSFVKIFLSETEIHSVRVSAAVVGAKSMSQYCRDLVVEDALRVTASLNVGAAAKATKRGKSAPKTARDAKQD